MHKVDAVILDWAGTTVDYVALLQYRAFIRGF